MTTSIARISLVMDNIVEMDEEFIVTLNQPTARGITLGSITTATGIIIDTTGEWLLTTSYLPLMISLL